MKRTLLVIGLCVGTSAAALATTDTPGTSELRGAVKQSATSMSTIELTGDVDHDFVAAMQRLHQDSIELARVQVKHGKDPSVRALAREIIDEQKRDLDSLEKWMYLRQIADKQK